jgi:hypothetical protein
MGVLTHRVDVMTNRSPLSFWLLMLAILPACASSARPSSTVEALPDQAELTIEVATVETVEAATEAPSIPLAAGATAMPGGFTTAAYNDPLPVFEPLIGGGDGNVPQPEPCWDYLTGGGPEALEIVAPPAVRVLNRNICILGMGNWPGSVFTVTMESPNGEVYESEFVVEEAGVVPVLRASDGPAFYGWAMPETGGPVTIITVDFMAGLAAGSWVITVQDSTEAFDQWTTALITHEEQQLDLTRDWPPSPFRWHSYQMDHIVRGEEAHIAGANYPPGTGIVIVLYSTDGTPLYATRIVTDGDGAFHTTIDAGADLNAGRYLLRTAIEPGAIIESGYRFIFVQD